MPVRRKKASAQNRQMLYKTFPPLIKGIRKETAKKGNSKNINSRKTKNPYKLNKNRLTPFKMLT